MEPPRFLPAVARWFADRFDGPTEPQRRAWPLVAAGRHVLVAAPTGSGKTLAAFLWALDGLFRRGQRLLDRTYVVYVSPLRALSRDIRENLEGPLADIRGLDPSLPEVRVEVRTGDTPASARRRMAQRPPHVLVTTPESLYLLLTSVSGRRMLAGARTVIVDEIHALAPNKRGSHLALTLERLEALAGPFQRIGLSATQRPLEEVAGFLGGVDRPVEIVDAGHLRALDVAVELPSSPLTAVCSHEVWDEIYERMAELVRAHRTTLLFVNTRKMAERLSARLAERLGEDQVRCHHGSLSQQLRLDAERRLKDGRLRALVATASLELGIDIGDVDLVIQVGAVGSIHTFLQRVGRSGHGVGRTPKGRLFPLTRDDLVEAAALLRAVREGELDRLEVPDKPLDILSQQIVAEAACRTWDVEDLFARLRRAWPYRTLEREEFDAVVGLHIHRRDALLHLDGVRGRVRAAKAARLKALQSGGAIPDAGDYRVLLEPDGTFLGTLNEDFALEANAGDIVQLGTSSWRILKVETGVVRVADAKGQPPTLPFWLGEAPGRTRELAREVGRLREEGTDANTIEALTGVGPDAARQIHDYFEESRRLLGALPTHRRLVCERFFDETGGTQVVLHCPFGSRLNRALGLALRKRICRGFGFELQAAVTEEAIVFSLGEKPGVPVDEIFSWLHPDSAREVLVQAVLPQPLFEVRWRWNVTRALLVDRMRHGKPVPVVFQKMRAQDELAKAFPEVVACPETLSSPDLPVPMDHPLVRQTVTDALDEAMDARGMVELLRGLREGTIEGVVVDTPTPSPLAHGVLAAGPYAFLDDAPLEERRVRAVATRRLLDPHGHDPEAALDPEVVAEVRREAWPRPRDAEDLHEVLCWIGYVREEEAARWRAWLSELEAQGRVVKEGDRYFAADASRDPVHVLGGRLEALGPVPEEVFDAKEREALARLEAEGRAVRIRDGGGFAWVSRRLLRRIQRRTVERLRREIEPVPVSVFLDFLAAWQGVTPERRGEGPRGVARALRRLAGHEAPARDWERFLLPARVRDYRREHLDAVTLSGEFVFARLRGSSELPVKITPLAFFPREEAAEWLAFAAPADPQALSGDARALLSILVERGALFPQELRRLGGLLDEPFERALASLLSHGFITADSFALVRSLLVAPSLRRGPIGGLQATGRVTPLARPAAGKEERPAAPVAEFLARALLRRFGVVFRRLWRAERLPLPWREGLFALRRLELRGEVRGGRFVAGPGGEQFALGEAVELLRETARRKARPALRLAPTDPAVRRELLPPDREAAGEPRAGAVGRAVRPARGPAGGGRRPGEG